MLNNRNKESVLVSETKNHKAIFSSRQAQKLYSVDFSVLHMKWEDGRNTFKGSKITEP